MSLTTPTASPTPAPVCENCEATLLGQHCYRCGQPIQGLVREFGTILGDAFDTLLNLDTRIVRTLWPLLAKPGFLSREYFAGHRVRFVSPVRLFVFLSVLAFLLAQWSLDFKVDAERGGRSLQVEPSRFDFNGKPWDVKTNPIAVAWLPSAANAQLNDWAGRAVANLQRGARDPNLLKNAFLSALPQTLFVLLPVFAGLLKLAYLFQRRLYMEHLIVALHSHAFLCLALALLSLLSIVDGWLANRTLWISGPIGWAERALALWMPIYLLLTQKRVYGQGWPMTLLKFSLLGFAYLFLLNLGALATLMLSLVWL